ncbi:hypothetical protein FEP45_04959 [Burkholderia multivorans]|nr:hypothetical protein [Burkholderia multivorans]
MQVEAERRLREPQSDRRPERAERRHRERGRQRMPPQHGFVGEQPSHRCQQRAVARRDGRCACRQSQRQHGCDRDVGRGGERIERAPADRARDQARERPRQQNAEHQPAHHVADGAPALRFRRHRRRHRHEHLDHARRGARDQRRAQKHRTRVRDGRQREHRRAYGERRHDHAAVLEQIDKRHEQREPGRVAELRQHRDEPGEARGQLQVGADRARQRLRGEQVDHDHADRRREEERHAGAQRRPGVVRRARGAGTGRGRAVHGRATGIVEGNPILGGVTLCDN